ncbi:pre-peptidase C-terminal domain-containing protein [Oscillatoria sp. FACHB-1407]|uniref:pre-peptidase C-terminal domain-containing protein n=1 Tax=Oscillatoria sp. FACHB-1407 TaxID=2692847 RepID=UPI0016831398|nr:pre-peptidase C-terminal domain-containing protein [Oscillatoria sp. FACHB-1407]MBD2463962.1 pre-peptidase C-terminal domain-containing protein [Oscillatoria sp. FACHB-1407]
MRNLVGGRDRFDIYKVNFAAASSFRATLRGLSANADLALLNSAGQVVKQSRRRGNANEVIATNVEAGIYYVRVAGSKTPTRFSLGLSAIASPDNNNTLEQAPFLGSLSGTKSFTGFVGRNDTDDFFRFDLAINRDVALSLTSLTGDANVALLDLNGTVIQNSSAGGAIVDQISQSLPTGTYFVRVTPGAGGNASYRLDLSADLQTPDLSAIGFQQSIQALSTVSGSLSDSDTLNPLRFGSYADDYLLNGITAGQSVQINLNSSDFDTYLQLVNNATGEEISFNDDANSSLNSELSFTAEAGITYRVRVTSYGAADTGNYTLTTSPASQSIGASAERTGSLSNTDSNNPLLTGRFFDDYRLTGATVGQEIRIDLESSFDNYLQLVNADTGQLIAFDDDTSEVNTNAQLIFTVAAGTNYLIRATSFTVGATGNYTLRTRPNIDAIAVNQSITSSLDVFDPSNSLRSGSYAEDYLLTGVTAGQPVRVNLDADFDTYLQLVNAATGALIDYNDDANGTFDSELTFTAQAGIQYILRASSFDSGVTGAFTLTTSGGVQTTDIGPTATVNGSLSTTDPDNPLRQGRYFDEYRLTGATAGQTIRINLGSEGFDTYLQLVDGGTGQEISFNDDANETLNSELSFVVQAGIDYRIRVTSFDSSEVGSYVLTTAGPPSGGGGSGGNSWIPANITDAQLQSAIASLSADNELSRNDMIAIFRNAGSDDGIVNTAEQTDLRTLVNNAPRFNMRDYVQYLSGQVANGISTNMAATTLEGLIGRHFLGTVTPTNSFNNATFTHTVVQGSLFGSTGSPRIDDIDQGGLGDCAFLAALGSVLNVRPNAIRDMLIDNGDNTYTVRFYSATNNNGTTAPDPRAEYVTVDRRLATSSNGRLLFANGGNLASNSANILWAPLVERAYAQWREFRENRNGYNLIGNGDLSYRPMTYITGRASTANAVTQVSFASIQAALAAGRPVAAGGATQDSTFIYGRHAYSVVAAFTNGAGQQIIRVRNPHGVDGLAPSGDPNDGFIDLTYSQYVSVFGLTHYEVG